MLYCFVCRVSLFCTTLYAECPYFVLLCMQSVLILSCFVCKVSLFCPALYASVLILSCFVCRCPYYMHNRPAARRTAVTWCSSASAASCLRVPEHDRPVIIYIRLRVPRDRRPVRSSITSSCLRVPRDPDPRSSSNQLGKYALCVDYLTYFYAGIQPWNKKAGR